MAAETFLYIVITSSGILKRGLTSNVKARSGQIRWGLGDGSRILVTIIMSLNDSRMASLSELDEDDLHDYLLECGYCEHRHGEFFYCRGWSATESIERFRGIISTAREFCELNNLNAKVKLHPDMLGVM